MKKLLVILGVLILSSACANNNLKSINLKTLNDKLDNKETFVLYLTDESEEGNVLKTTLNNLKSNNDFQVFTLNTDKLNKDDSKALKEKFTFENTNIIIFIKNGQENTVISRIDDPYISENNLKEELKNQEYIK